MSKPWDTTSLPFYGGLDSKTDELIVSMGKLVELENGIFVNHGAVSKRQGYEGFEETYTGLGTFKNELLGSNETGLYSKAEDSWQKKGDFSYMTVNKSPVVDALGEQSNADRSETLRYRVYVWENDGIEIAVQAVVSGQYVHQEKLSATGVNPRCISIGTNTTVLWAETGDTNINYAIVNDNNPASLTVDTLLTDVTADALFDICRSFAGDRYFIGYRATGTSDLKVARVTKTGVVEVSATSNLLSVAPTRLTVTAGETHAALFYVDSTGLTISGVSFESPESLFEYRDDGVAIVTKVSSDTISSITSITRAEVSRDYAAVFFTLGTTVYTLHENYEDWDQTHDDTLILHATLAGHAFRYEGQSFVPVEHTSGIGLQNTYFLVRGPDIIDQLGAHFDIPVMGQVMARFGTGVGTTSPPSADIHLPSSWDAKIVMEKRNRLELPDGDTDEAAIVYSARTLEDFTFDMSAGASFVEAGQATYSAGGIIWAYDGVTANEANFLLYPEPDITLGAQAHSFVSVTGSGGSIGIGVYGYRIVYERTTATGERIRSFSVPFSVNVSGGSAIVELTIPTLSFTRADDVRVTVWRTEAGLETYYQVTDIDPANDTGNNRYVDNDPTADSVVFIDALADASITDREKEPLTGGVLPAKFIPSGDIMAYSKRRIFVTGQTGNRVYYSKLRVEGAPVEFNPALYIDIDEAGGPITELNTLNDNLVVFKESRIYLVAGDGPNNLGQGGFQEPVSISTDSGCLAKGTSTQAPMGVLYNSRKGKYLLNLGGQVQYIGADVERYNDLTCVAATLLPDQNAVLFLHSDGVALYYDYNFNSWSTFTGHKGQTAVVWDNNYVFAGESKLFIQDDSFRDDHTVYRMRAKTAPIRVEGLQGWWRCKRVYLLGTYFSDHKLRMNVFYDRKKAWTQSILWEASDFIDTATWGSQDTWGSGDVWGGTGQDYQMVYGMHPQKCQSFQLEFIEVPGADPGKSFQLTELAIVWRNEGGLGRVTPNRRK